MDRLTIMSKRVNENLDSLETYVESYRTLTRKVGTSVMDKEEESSFISNIEELSLKVKQVITTIRNKIVNLNEMMTEKLPPREKEVAEWHVNAHSKRLINLTNRFREYNYNFKTNEENKTKFLFKTANLTATEKQIDEYAKSPGSNTKVHSYFSLGDNTKQLKINEALRRQNRIRRINDLSEEIKEITDIIAELVYKNSERVENLADDFFMVEQCIKSSNDELQTTLDYKIRRGRFWRGVAYVVILGVGSYAIYMTMSYATKSN